MKLKDIQKKSVEFEQQEREERQKWVDYAKKLFLNDHHMCCLEQTSDPFRILKTISDKLKHKHSDEVKKAAVSTQQELHNIRSHLEDYMVTFEKLQKQCLQKQNLEKEAEARQDALIAEQKHATKKIHEVQALLIKQRQTHEEQIAEMKKQMNDEKALNTRSTEEVNNIRKQLEEYMVTFEKLQKQCLQKQNLGKEAEARHQHALSAEQTRATEKINEVTANMEARLTEQGQTHHEEIAKMRKQMKEEKEAHEKNIAILNEEHKDALMAAEQTATAEKIARQTQLQNENKDMSETIQIKEEKIRKLEGDLIHVHEQLQHSVSAMNSMADTLEEKQEKLQAQFEGHYAQLQEHNARLERENNALKQRLDDGTT